MAVPTGPGGIHPINYGEKYSGGRSVRDKGDAALFQHRMEGVPVGKLFPKGVTYGTLMGGAPDTQ